MTGMIIFHIQNIMNNNLRRGPHEIRRREFRTNRPLNSPGGIVAVSPSAGGSGFRHALRPADADIVKSSIPHRRRVEDIS